MMNTKRMFKRFACKATYLILCVALLTPCIQLAFLDVSYAEEPQPVYISDIKMVNDKNSDTKGRDNAYRQLEEAGYTVVPYDLNSGTGYGWAYLGYKTTTDPNEAITDMKIMNMEGGWMETTYNAVKTAYASTVDELRNDVMNAITEFRANYYAGSPAAKTGKLTLDKLYIPEKDNISLADYILNPDSEENLSAFIEEFLLKGDVDLVSTIYTPLMLGTVDYDPNAEEVEDGQYVPYSFLARVIQYDEEDYEDEAANAILNNRVTDLLSSSFQDTVNFYLEARSVSEDERTDEQKISVYIYDVLNQYENNYGKNLGDALLSKKNITRKYLKGFVAALSEGQFAMMKYCGLESFVIASANRASGYEEALKIAEAENMQPVSVWENANLEEYEQTVGLTSEAYRKQVAKKDFELYKTDKSSKSTVEAIQSYAQKITLVIVGIGFIANGLKSIVVTEASWAITQAIARFLATKVVAGILSVVSKVAVAAGWIGLAIDVAIAAYLFVVYMIDKYYVPTIDYSKQPAMPLLMYDVAKDSNGESYYAQYDLVTTPSGERPDLNCYQGQQWLGVYTSKDPELGAPILADSFRIEYANGITPTGYSPLCRFGEVGAYNTNSFAKKDRYNGIYVYYQKEGEGSAAAEGQYLEDIAIFASNDDDTTKTMISNKGYQYFNYNLGPHMYTDDGEYYKFIYIAYKTTDRKDEAITDIRIKPLTSVGTLYGEASYTNALVMTCEKGKNPVEGSAFANFNLIYTTYEVAGDPILADLYFSNQIYDSNVPDNYEPIIPIGGGPAFNFGYLVTASFTLQDLPTSVSTDSRHFYLTDDWMKYYVYVYFKSSVDYSENPDYISGINFTGSTIPKAGSNFHKDDQKWYLDNYVGYTYKFGMHQLKLSDIGYAENYVTLGKVGYSAYSAQLGYTTTKNPKRAIKQMIAYSSDTSTQFPYNLPITGADGNVNYFCSSTTYFHQREQRDRFVKWTASIDSPTHSNASYNYGSSSALYVVSACQGDPITVDGVIATKDPLSEIPEGYTPVTNYFDDSAANIKKGDKRTSTYLYYKGSTPSRSEGKYLSRLYVGKSTASMGDARLQLIANGTDTILYEMDSNYHKSQLITSALLEDIYQKNLYDSIETNTSIGAAYTDDELYAIRGIRLYAEKDLTYAPKANSEKIHNNVKYKLVSTEPVTFITHQNGHEVYPVYMYYSTNEACGSPITSIEFRKEVKMDGAEIVEYQNDSTPDKKFALLNHLVIQRENKDAKYVSGINNYRGWFKYNTADLREVAEKGDMYYNSMAKLDLNSKAGGRYLQLVWKNSKARKEAITDIVAFSTKSSKKPPKTKVVNGITYALACSGQDFNEGAGGKYLYLYYTKDTSAGDPVGDIVVDKNESKSGYETVRKLKGSSDNYTKGDEADMNEGAGGDYVYIHLKRVPKEEQTNFIGSIFSDDVKGGLLISTLIILAFLFVWSVLYYRKKKQSLLGRNIV